MNYANDPWKDSVNVGFLNYDLFHEVLCFFLIYSDDYFLPLNPWI